MKPYERSTFPHERDALKAIYDALDNDQRAGRVHLFCNIELVDPSTKSLLECDLILLSSRYIAIVELKHYFGRVDVSDYSWRVNQREVPFPHGSNNHKTKVLKSILSREYPTVRAWPYIHSTVVVTHEEADVHGNVTPPGDKRAGLQTFGSIRDFLAHVKQAIKSDGPELDSRALSASAGLLAHLSSAPRGFSDQVAGYEIIGELRRTSLCTEYLAYPKNPIDRSLKRLRVFGELLHAPELRAKQRRNLDLLGRIPAHPHIVRSGLVNAGNLLVEESPWSETGTLRSLIKDGHPLPAADALRFATQILSALQHVHANDVVHRDLIPENILITGETAQLMNFDRAYDPSASHTVMDTEELGRKSPYRAPEVFEGRADFKSDLFAFGVVFYEMLVGHKPIKSWQTLVPTGGRLSTKILSELTTFPENVAELISDCITLDPALRPEAREALARLRGEREAVQRYINAPNALLLPGERALTLEIQEFLGRGASAQVYRALNHDETTIIKLFNIETPPELVRHERSVNRRVSSPAVVKVHSAFQWPDGRSGLEFQDVGGSSMRAAIDAGERPDRERFIQVADRLLAGISDLHEDHVARLEDRKPLLHNDLNPSNILLSEAGVYIIDLGVASEPGIGPFCGIPLYVAPDLALGGELSREPNGDLFTAALSLFEWVTGVHPFGGRIPGTSELDLTSLPEWAAKVAPWFEKALHCEAGHRFGSASEMRENLRQRLHPPEEIFQVETLPMRAMAPAIYDESVTRTAQMLAFKECGSRAFVAYLNSLHNVSASNENALAESQALSPYFAQIYVSVTRVTDDIERLLRAPADSVVVLSGHAGDGKSTIALDLFRRLKGLPHDMPLARALDETEVFELDGRKISIIKDLSELAAEKRLAAFRAAFNEPGTWLIIANTGPLLNTCIALGKDNNLPQHKVEDELLRVLSEPLRAGVENAHKVGLFQKPLWVANLTKIDNVPLAGQVLRKLVAPHLWSNCDHCPARKQCPISLNVESIRECPEAITRVERVYRRLTEYDQRLTARQLTAHLAYSVTGGLECAEVLTASTDTTAFIGNFLFADRFFGSAGATLAPKADELQVVRLLRPLEFGASPFREVDLLTASAAAVDSLALGPVFQAAFKEQVVRPPQGRERSRLRQSFRRQLYFFASPKFRRFRDDFLRSPRLFDMEDWFSSPPSRQENKALRNKTLGVILEEFTGFSAGQYARNNQSLYITLRRGDLRFPQMVQLVLARMSYDDFAFNIDPVHREVTLRYQPRSGGVISLDLSLPLLDYIAYRQLGEVGEALDPIFKQRLDSFKAALLASSRGQSAAANDGVLQMIQATVSGALRICEVEFKNDELHIDYA